MSNKKKTVIFVIIVIIFIKIAWDIIQIYKIESEKYHSLDEMTSIDLTNLYIKGRVPYDFDLNAFYGKHSKAKKIHAVLGETDRKYYDENGNKVLEIRNNSLKATVNGVDYLYIDSRRGEMYTYKPKELYPDKEKGGCRELLYNIIKLYQNDDEYSWEDIEGEDTIYYSDAVKFINEGIVVKIYEYQEENLGKDFNINYDIKEINEETEYENLIPTFIKYKNMIIEVSHLYTQADLYPENLQNNIDIFDNYLVELSKEENLNN